MRRYAKLFLIACFVMLLFGCQAVPRGEVPPPSFQLGEDIVIEGVDVSRMEVQEAETVLQQHMRQKVANMSYEIRLRDAAGAEAVRLLGDELPITANVREMVQEAAYLPQHNGLRKEPRAFDIGLQLDADAIQERLGAIIQSFYIAPVDATATFDLNQAGYFVFTSEKSGRKADAAELTRLLQEAVQREESATLELSVTTLDPGYTEQQARAEHRLISTFTTSYAKSPLNASGRVFNIKKAAGLINGYVIAPDEEFNTNKVLGPRNAQTGWKTAPGIREGRYEQEYGGGVCQVSTTLYNALLCSGPEIEITERKHHSWPSHYADYGLDATVSTGGPNLAFINNTSATLYIFAYANDEDYTMTVYIYGAPLPDGVTYKVRGVTTETIEPEETIVTENPDWPTGFTYKEVAARTGYVAIAYRDKYVNGELKDTEELYTDKYRAVQGKTTVGTGDASLPKPSIPTT